MERNTQKMGHLRTASDPSKSLRQYEELKAAGHIKHAVVIVERQDGNFEILGQSASPHVIANMLMVAAEAVAEIPIESTEDPSPPPFAAGKPINTIAAAWARFEAQAIDAGAHAGQRKDLRMAFYVGGWASVKALIDATSDDDGEPTGADLASMEQIHREFLDFFRKAAGRDC